MTDDTPFLLPDADEGDEFHAASPTACVCDALMLTGYRPAEGEPDHRPLPERGMAEAQLTVVFDGFATMLNDTQLEGDLEDLLWSTVNLFHRKIERIERDLDANEQAQRKSQALQDGSEIRSVELERLLDQGQQLLDRRNSFESFRDYAVGLFEAATGSAWRPRAGSMVSHRAMTASVIDSRDFIAARKRQDAELRIPPGTRIAFTGGLECQEVDRIWAALDKTREKHPDMVLLHGGSPKGAERIAALWADNRKVPQIVFKPDWTRHAKAAPFKRNDQMLEALPAGLIAFPGSGISANLADKARRLGIPVWKFAEGAA
jgi:hypothetical protein